MDYKEKLLDPRWQRKRLEIMQRDGFTCTCCGDDKETLNVHHMKYNGDPWEVDSSLLITFCETCHVAHGLYKDCTIRKIIKVKHYSGNTMLIIFADPVLEYRTLISVIANGEIIDHISLSDDMVKTIYNEHNKIICNG